MRSGPLDKVAGYSILMGRVCIRLTAELSPTFWKASPSRSMGTEAKRPLFASCQTSRRLLLIAVQQIAMYLLTHIFEIASYAVSG